MACSRGTGGSGSFYRPCGDAVRTASLVVHCQSCYDGGARRVVAALRECLHRWCGPRSSKPVAGVNNARCRFDSDTLPLFCRPVRGHFGWFVAGFCTFACVFRGFGHRLAPLQQKSGSFEGGKTIAIALFSRGNAFFDRRCPTPIFAKVLPRLEIPLFLQFGLPPTDHSDAFLPGFSGFRCGGTRP